MNLVRWLRRQTVRTVVKAAGLPVISPWVNDTFLTPTFLRLTRDGYQKNSVFFACVSALTFAFPEPPPIVYQDNEPIPQHPLRLLLQRPNPRMGEAELMLYTMQYMAIGGNAYWYKLRNRAGRVVQLWPYHAGQIHPIPGGDNWIAGYEFETGNGVREPIASEDIVHFKWPAIDPDQPWVAQSPIRAAAREVDADNEAIRYMFALLKNDAIPRTVIEMPPETDMTEQEVRRMKEQWRVKYGGDNRGDVSVLTGGAKVQRLGLDLQEMAFDSLSRIPETRICAVMRVPPIVIGMSSGLENSTYSNAEEAERAFTRRTLLPLWRLVESEIQADLVPEFDSRSVVKFDTSRVQALQEDEGERRAFLLSELQSGAITLNEYRQSRGYADTPDGDVFYMPMQVIVSTTPTGAMQLPEPTPEPEQRAALPAPERKALHLTGERKARANRERQRIERRLEHDARVYLREQYQAAADVVAARGGDGKSATRRILPISDDRGVMMVALDGKRVALSAIETKLDDALWAAIVAILDTGTAIAALARAYWSQAIELAFGDAGDTLNVSLDFDLENTFVQEVLGDLAQLVSRVSDTTRDEIRALVGLQAEMGWSIDDLAEEIANLGQIRSKTRAVLIARSETARAYSEGSLLAYAESGVVEESEWLTTDGACPICAPLNGKRAPLGGEFAPGIRVPGDPHPGDRCSLAPVVEV